MADNDLEALVRRIPTGRSATPTLRCCCGCTDCVYLKHNCTALDELEQEVRTAAQLGQALLVRHEAYMVNAERERLEMSAKIEKLETDKRQLEAENAKTIEENRELMDQVEGLNSTVAESETQILSLESTLQSTRYELRRLEGLASRTHDLELQLAALEQEQEALQKAIVTTDIQERSAIQRWKKAERRLYELQEQLERIEREAREERERHVEVLGRMERQRTVERELDTAAGRLKGAAAATTGNVKNGSSVISHFVKDILQDNANLQLGIVELREMLMNSNNEVQSLREQLLFHQPIVENNGNDSGPPTLRAELAPKETAEPKVISQELHIHHHYHTPAKKEDARRPRKKRTSINTALFTPPLNFHSPRAPRANETVNTVLSQTSATVPAPFTPNNRWSMQSGQMSDVAPSSVPSSPQSIYRNSTLFDRGFDSSRPTSPGSSVDPLSPTFQPYHKKRGSDMSSRSFLVLTNFQPENIIHEEDSDVEELADLKTPSVPSLEDDIGQSDSSNHSDFQNHHHDDWIQPKLRRSASHESILSISGIDIHTLKSRPSQLTITGGGALLRQWTRQGGASPTASEVSVNTLTSSSIITAKPTLSRQVHDSTSYLRYSMAHSDTHLIRSSPSIEGLGKKAGWVWGRWGASPSQSPNSSRGTMPISAPQNQTASTFVDPLKAFMGRPPGINQKGPIPGFRRSEKAPSHVKPDTVDHEALREVLME